MNKQIQRIHISIAFGDAILPVIEFEGHQRVPLKVISDQIGLDWKSQKRKIINDEYLKDRFGLILGEASLPQMAQLGLKGDQYLIRLDRVTSFLNILNPQQITSQGNHEAAQWLKAKHTEWDDALHSYETNGFASKDDRSKRDKYTLLSKLDGMKNNEIKRIFAENLNKDYGFDIPIGKQNPLPL